MCVQVQPLVDCVLRYDSGANTDLIIKAFELANQAHQGQKRISGDPYITHPLEVALILADIEMDTASICAALLHDVVEDTKYTYNDILHIFGEEIAVLVDGVTKLSRINFKSREDAQAENLRKMFLAMARDIRVLLIKLADRLHNMRTLDYQSERKQQEIAQETMEIFAPLAHRWVFLGLNGNWKIWPFPTLIIMYIVKLPAVSRRKDGRGKNMLMNSSSSCGRAWIRPALRPI
jgi:guanosine-3',5'-bis(diphosphate) 3'-pyrophosphohydrolase